MGEPNFAKYFENDADTNHAVTALLAVIVRLDLENERLKAIIAELTAGDSVPLPFEGDGR